MIALSKKELAEATGYTYRRLHQIDQELPEDKKLFVHCEEGKYDLAMFMKRWVEYNIEKHSVNAEDLKVVKAEHEIVKKKKTELEVARLSGKLVAVDEIKLLWGNIANTVMQNMLHLPSKIAPELIMQDNIEVIASIISDEIRKVLNSIADTPLPDYIAEEEEE